MIIPTLLIVLSLPCLIIITNILALSFSDFIYKDFFKNSEDLHYAMNVVSYLKFGQNLSENYFSPQAITHLADVKNLFDFVKALNAIFIFAVFSLAFYLIRQNKFMLLKKGLILGILFTTLVLLLIFISALINFDFAFLIFHKLLFNNDLWLFDPADNLVNLFSQDFFTHFLRKLTTNILITLLLLLLAIRFIPNASKRN